MNNCKTPDSLHCKTAPSAQNRAILADAVIGPVIEILSKHLTGCKGILCCRIDRFTHTFGYKNRPLHTVWGINNWFLGYFYLHPPNWIIAETIT